MLQFIVVPDKCDKINPPQPFQCITYDPPAPSLVGDWVARVSDSLPIILFLIMIWNFPGNHNPKRNLHPARWIHLPLRVQRRLRHRAQDLQHLRERLQNHEGRFHVRSLPILRHQEERDLRNWPGNKEVQSRSKRRRTLEMHIQICGWKTELLFKVGVRVMKEYQTE